MQTLESALQSINQAFFNVADIIASIQGYFIKAAHGIAYVVLLISVLTLGLNYALTGSNLKENIVKLLKAVVFYTIIIFFFPAITGWITNYTFKLASGSVYNVVKDPIKETKADITMSIQNKANNPNNTDAPTFADDIMASEELKESFTLNQDPIFRRIFQRHSVGNMTYTAVAPASALMSMFLVAGECFNFEKKGSFAEKIGMTITGLICGFFVIFTGAICVLEYCVTFLEFMLVTSVGIILFPLSLWEGSKFMTEKLVGAIVGFFMKLLFCNISIFLTMYIFMKIAGVFVEKPFTGKPDELITMIFSCLFAYFICKSGPGLAQSLLTGAPTLNAAGAISSVAGAAMGAMALGGMAAGAVKTAGGVAGSAAKAVSGGAGAMSASGTNAGFAASNAVGAMASSLGGDLARSLGNTKAGQTVSRGIAGIKGGVNSLKESFAAGAAGVSGEGETSAGSSSGGETGSVSGGASSSVSASISAGGGSSGSGGASSGAGAAGTSSGGGGSSASLTGASAASPASAGGGSSGGASAAAAAASPASAGGQDKKAATPRESNVRKFAEGFATAAGAHLPGAGNPGEGALSGDKEEEKKEDETPKPEVTLKKPENPAAGPGAASGTSTT